MTPLTPWVRRLLMANVVMFFVTASSPALQSALLLYPPLVLVRPWTLVTYMFLHGGLAHLFFNMLGLYFFGPRLEERMGGRGFALLYFLSGLGGAVFSLLFARQYPVVGASGAVYGVLLGYALHWPRHRIYLWLVIPVEAWLLATLLVFGSLWMGVNSQGSSTAHFAHLGGLLFGFAFVKWWDWKRGSGKRAFQKAINPQPVGLGSERSAMNRWKGIPLEGMHVLNREEVVRLLRKVEADGAGSLTPAERGFLDRMSGA